MAISGIRASVQLETFDWYELVSLSDGMVLDLQHAAVAWDTTALERDPARAELARALAAALEAACSWSEGEPILAVVCGLMDTARNLLSELTLDDERWLRERPTIPVLYDAMDADGYTLLPSLAAPKKRAV